MFNNMIDNIINENFYNLQMNRMDEETKIFLTGSLGEENKNHIKRLEGRLDALNRTRQEMYQQHDEIITQLIKQNITKEDFNQISSEYSREFDPLLLEIQITKMELEARKDLEKRLILFKMILSFPNNATEREIKYNGQTKTLRLEDLYQNFAKLITVEKIQRLELEQETIRLYFSYNSNRNYEADANNKFYLNDIQKQEYLNRLEQIKADLQRTKSQPEYTNGIDVIDATETRVGDFINPDIETVYNNLFEYGRRR